MFKLKIFVPNIMHIFANLPLAIKNKIIMYSIPTYYYLDDLKNYFEYEKRKNEIIMTCTNSNFIIIGDNYYFLWDCEYYDEYYM